MDYDTGPRLSSLLIVIVTIPVFKCDVDSQTESCPSSIAPTGSSGSILMQSASVKERFGTEMSNAAPSLLQPAQREEYSTDSSTKDFMHSASTFKMPFNFSRDVTLLSSYVTLRNKAITNWTGGHSNILYRIGLDSTVPLFLALLLLFVILGAACWMVLNPPNASTRVEFSSRPGDPQSLTSASDMMARAKFDSRAYASSSPMVPDERRQRVPLERARSSPQASVANVPRGRTPPRPGRDLSSDTRRFSGGMSAPPSNNADNLRAFNPTASSIGQQFCPELIVPQHCECILFVPFDSDRHSSFDVTDCNGSCVLRVVPQPPAAGRLWRATITSGTGELLAQCCEASYQASSRYAPEFHLLQSAGQLWAKLLHSPTQERYVLNFVNGGVLHFWGNFDERAVNITNETNQLLATTEVGSADFDPNGRYYSLRVAPTADVGLVVCGLLCIGQHMTSQRKANASI